MLARNIPAPDRVIFYDSRFKYVSRNEGNILYWI